MLVFRQQHQRLLLAPHLRVLAAETAAYVGVPRHDTLVGWLIDCAEIESAVADVFSPDYDTPHPLAQSCADATRAAADAVVASWQGDPDRVLRARDHLTRTLRAFSERPWPLAIATIDRPVLEGFAYYSLTPEMYIRSATAIADRFKPSRACIIGIRSIGTGLAALVASTLATRGVACESVTVRPRGHPFDRDLKIASSIVEGWRASTDALFIIADEGPGLSGSSFATMVQALIDIGIGIDRIVIMPSAPIDAARLRSEHARALLPRVTSITTPFEQASPLDLTGLRDVSAGAWRADSFAHESQYPAVFPRHERRKYRQVRPGANPDGAWLKWIGLGRYGRANHARAMQMAEWGMAPPPVSAAHGFMLMPHVPGQPQRWQERGPGIVTVIAEYLARIARDCRIRWAYSSHRDLSSMLRTNVREGLGLQWVDRADTLMRHKASAISAADWLVQPDARMLPHEWLRTPTGGFVKTDGFEHHDDHFFPGLTDIAWDVAGACVEWRLTPREEAALLDHYRARSGDAHIGPRLGFFRAAYLAFRMGYTDLATATLGDTPDGRRFARLRERYAQMLSATLGVTRTHIVGPFVRKNPRTPPGRAADSYDADEDRTTRG